MKLSRNQWILVALAVLLVGQVSFYFWRNWGLITVHAKGTPLGQVVHSIERQGHVTIKTNLDLTKPVKMWVDHVALSEALETLAAVTDSRWRLTYVMGPDNGTVKNALANFTAGQQTEGWKTVFIPVPSLGESPDVIPDPRKDLWNVKPVSDATFQAYVMEAAKNVSASFWFPENWNPAVKAAPSSGTIRSALPKLVGSAHGNYEEVFLLQGSRRRPNEGDDQRERGDDEPRFAGNFGGGNGRGGFDRNAMEERIQNEINKLPADQRAVAQREHDERKAFFDSLKDLTPEQRQQRIQDMMNDPNIQQKMDDARNQRDSRMSPDQRISRAQGYLSRMASARAAAGN